LPPRLHPPSIGDLCMDVFFFGRHSRWCVEVVVPHLFMLFVCVFRIPPVILGLHGCPLCPCSSFSYGLSFNEKTVKDPILKKITEKEKTKKKHWGRARKWPYGCRESIWMAVLCYAGEHLSLQAIPPMLREASYTTHVGLGHWRRA